MWKKKVEGTFVLFTFFIEIDLYINLTSTSNIELMFPCLLLNVMPLNKLYLTLFYTMLENSVSTIPLPLNKLQWMKSFWLRSNKVDKRAVVVIEFNTVAMDDIKC